MVFKNDFTKRAKSVSLVIGIITASITGLISLPTFWRSFGLPAFATEYHVEEKLKPITAAITLLSGRIDDTTIETSEVRRSQIDKELFEHTVKLSEVVDFAIKAMINERVKQLTLEREAVIRRITSLQRDKYGRH